MRSFFEIELGDHGDGWFLDFPVDSKTGESIDHGPIVLNGIVPTDLPSQINVPIHQNGSWMNFSVDAFSLFFAGGSVLEVFKRMCSSHVSFIDCLVDGKEQGIKMLVLHSLLDCLDFERSQIDYYTEEDCEDEDDRRQKLGKIHYVRKLRIDPRRVPDEVHIFRLKQSLTRVIVSGNLRDLLLEAGIQGAEFAKC